MSAKERVMCPECFGTGAASPTEAGEAECTRCHGIGTVLKESDQLGTSEKAELEAIIKEMSDECDKLRSRNKDLEGRLEIIKDKAEYTRQENEILRARLEMVYLFFGGKLND